MTVIATGFDARFRGRRTTEQPTVAVPARTRERARETREQPGVDVPADVLEVPSFLRDD